MDKINIASPSNGIPYNWDDLEFILGQGSYDGGIIPALTSILSSYGDNFIIQGCVKTGANYTAGWIFLDGEILKVDAHAATSTHWQKVTSNNADGNKQTQLSGTVDIYQENRGVASAGSGSLTADGNEPRYFNPTWTSLTLINGWDGGSNYARYRKYADGTVELDIFIVLLGAPSSDILATLPVDNRPLNSKYFRVEDTEYDDDSTARCIINVNGNIDISFATHGFSDSGYSFTTRFPTT